MTETNAKPAQESAMTTARQVAIEMLTAAEAGKAVQFRAIDDPMWIDIDWDRAIVRHTALRIPYDFDPSRYEWRVKPEPAEVWIDLRTVTAQARVAYDKKRDGLTLFREVID